MPAPMPELHRQINDLLLDNPGRDWRPRDVALHLGIPTHRAAVLLRRLWEKGWIDRHWQVQGPYQRSTYQAKNWPD